MARGTSFSSWAVHGFWSQLSFGGQAGEAGHPNWRSDSTQVQDYPMNYESSAEGESYASSLAVANVSEH